MTSLARLEPAIDSALPIVDTHHHLYDRISEAHAAIAEGKRRYLIDELLADMNSGHNVIATVHVDGGAMYRADGPDEYRVVGETEFVNGQAAMSASGVYGPSRIAAGIVGRADLRFGDRVKGVLEAHLAAGGGRFRGIRQTGAWDADEAIFGGMFPNGKGLYRESRFRRGFAQLEPLGLSFDAFVLSTQLSDVADLAAAFPDTRIVLDHAGGPIGIGPYRGRLAEMFPAWKRGIVEIARRSNVVMKLGGLGSFVNGFPTFRAQPPANLPGARRRLAAVRRSLDRSLRRRPLHVRVELSRRQWRRPLRNHHQRLQASHCCVLGVGARSNLRGHGDRGVSPSTSRGCRRVTHPVHSHCDRRLVMNRSRILTSLTVTAIIGVVMAQPPRALAQATEASTSAQSESTQELAKKVVNPLTDMVSVPLQFNWISGVGPNEELRMLTYFQPVVPVSISKSWNVIGRWVMPYLSQPAAFGGSSGMGDIMAQAFFSPKSSNDFTWGAGPMFNLPTTSDPTLGFGKWAAGPAVAVMKQKGGMTYGMLWNNIWSFAGTGTEPRPDVNMGYFQPVIAHTSHSGVTVMLSTEAVADWNAAHDDRWSVPVNGLVSKLIRFGAVPMSVQVGGGYYLARPTYGPSWQMRTTFTLIMPRQR